MLIHPVFFMAVRPTPMDLKFYYSAPTAAASFFFSEVHPRNKRFGIQR